MNTSINQVTIHNRECFTQSYPKCICTPVSFPPITYITNQPNYFGARKVPHTCPKCNGHGSHVEDRLPIAADLKTIQCFPCNGTGLVWEKLYNEGEVPSEDK